MVTKLKSRTPLKKPSASSKRRWFEHAHDYQLRALEFMLARTAAGLFLDPGLGKTSITYAAVSTLKRNKLPHGTLVVAPRRPALMVWPQEHQEWADFSDLSVGVMAGLTERKRAEVWDQQHDVYVIGYEGFVWLIKTKRISLRELKKRGIVNLVFDELSKMKNTRTLRAKTIKKILHFFQRRWGLTGSPAANGLMDLFGECYALDMGETLGQYITHYRARYFQAFGDPRYPSYDLRPGAEEEIYARLGGLAIRIDAEDHLKMPKLFTNKIVFDLPSEVAPHYRTMEEEFFAALPDGDTITASHAGALVHKLRQMAGGALYEDPVDPVTGIPRTGKRQFKVLHQEKVDALEELIDELNGQQVLVMYYYGHDLAQIYKRFGELPTIGGGTSDKKALEYQEQWNRRHLRVLLAHPDSVGHGLNLQKGGASQIAVYSMPHYNLEYYDQFIRRLRRQGNTAPRVFVHHLLARNTIDNAVFAALKNKGSMQKRLHDALKEYQQGRSQL